jgi:general secretion pathway protein A
MDYLDHFGLAASPFTTTPDPRFAYATREHRQALNKIAYYTEERRGIFLLTGNIGTGKTTLSKLLLNHWIQSPDKFTVAHVIDPSPRTSAAFLRLVLASFGLPRGGAKMPRNVLDLKAHLRGFLVEEYKSGRTVILLLDEAQSMELVNLDVLQVLWNEQTQTTKLIQIVLLAQPNFEFKLTQRPALRSRIAGGTTLNPLTFEDSLDMLRHRMDVAGGDFDSVFPAPLHKAIYNATNGVPRDLCVLCDAAMINALTVGEKVVSDQSMANALNDLRFKDWLGKRTK